MSDGQRERTDRIVDCFEEAFRPLMRRDPAAFRRRFRRMAKDPFAFYRGSACLFYADMEHVEDQWVDDKLSRVWIHGDLHAENFGTYMDGRGILVFDVNDFDEAYFGHYTWDLRRCAASLALLGWRKAFPDQAICEVVGAYVRAYVEQIRFYTEQQDDQAWAFTLDNARGPVLDTLLQARSSSRTGLLERGTFVDKHERRFRESGGVRWLEGDEQERVLEAFAAYRGTVSESEILNREIAYDVKSVVGRSGFGIGSAGLNAYNVLIEGRSQALENDVILSMKEGNTAAPSAIVHDQRLHELFDNNGHRTALSQHALQAYADPFLGWTVIDGTGYVVRELSPYEADLDWDDIAEVEAVTQTAADLGRATAKVHCVSDADAEAFLVEEQVEGLVLARIGDNVEALVRDLQGFALSYADRTRADHRLFVDAFRAGAFESVTST